MGCELHHKEVPNGLRCTRAFRPNRVVLMPRNNRKSRSREQASPAETDNELRLDLVRSTLRRTVTKRGVDFVVQNTSGTAADPDKSWVCPHCNVQIVAGTAHVVAWDEVRGPETRRHFHSQCFKSFQGPLF